VSRPDQAFQQLVAALDYPMFVVTAAATDPEEERSGCLVGFATQCSIDPPRMVVCLSKKNHTYRVAQRSEHLAVHFLRSTDLDTAKLFGEETGDEVDKFAGGRCRWTPGPQNLPLLEDCAGWFVGRILDRIDGGDHVAHVVDVIESENREGPGQLGFQAVRDFQPGHDA
jgi:flavin reductase (DIM6/NTAB) family NADH-FMN oxidoreductase RutF